MPIKKIIITGSSGTIGTRLAEILIEQGFEVIGVDKRKNAWRSDVDAVTRIADLRDSKATLEAIPHDADVIIHLAANARVHDLVMEPSMAMDNELMTFNVLEAAREHGIKRIMFASSREVYGNAEAFVHSENDASIRRCESPYTASKIAGEAMVWAYHRCYDIDIIIFRFSNVYGMYDESDRVIPLFIRSALSNEPLTVFGKEKLLDFTHVDDTVDGISAFIGNFEESRNKTFNIAFGEGTSILRVAELIKQKMASGSEIVMEGSRTGEVLRYVADIESAKKAIGYEPKVSIEMGVERAVEWYREHAGIRYVA